MKLTLLTNSTLDIQKKLNQLVSWVKKLTKINVIPSLRLDDFDQNELLDYLSPIQTEAEKVSFSVAEYTHGATVVAVGYCCGVYSPTRVLN